MIRNLRLTERDINDWDEATFQRLVSIKLTEEQIEEVANPQFVYLAEKSILALHWHPEQVPVSLAIKRLNRMFPNVEQSLIIPTQHNQLTQLDGYAGLEIDCFASEFDRKIQLLLHFKQEKLADADVFNDIISHTAEYRISQFNEFVETVINPRLEDRMLEAIEITGVDEELIEFVLINTRKLKELVEANVSIIDPQMIRNKLLINFFSSLVELYNTQFVHQAVHFLTVVKEIVKRNFSKTYFHDVHTVIEEARRLGGCVIVPHPEQFWPVLLADYDVDGYEVWNPQSFQYTQFLIDVVNKKNQKISPNGRRLLVTMGDDTHMGEKILTKSQQDTEKASREVGYQPAWHNPVIKNSLSAAGFDKDKIIDEYYQRLN